MIFSHKDTGTSFLLCLRVKFMKDEQGVNTSLQRYRVIPRVLCFVLRGDRVLLLKGAPTRRIWANKYNGVGGHVERDEDVYSAAIREIREETGLMVSDVRLRGIVNIDAGGEVGVMLFVFTARHESDQVTPSPEGSLEWVPTNDLPTAELVQDLTTLLPRVLSDSAEIFFAHYRYDEQDRLVISFGGDDRF